jgi:DNA-binding CsgD family transcriptional regulator
MRDDPLERVERFIDEIDAVADLCSVRSILSDHTKELGFDNYSYQKLVPPTGVVQKFYLSTYPRDWIWRYNEQRYLSHDMYALSAASFTRAYRWAEVGRFDDFTVDQKQAINEAREFGIKTGASVPIYGPAGARAHLALASRLPQSEFNKLFRNQRHTVSLLAGYLHERLLALQFYDKPEPSFRLTPREMEILTWGARGKTNAEIGDILGISDETVMSHFRNAGRKLGASNKTHAVAAALVRHLIFP